MKLLQFNITSLNKTLEELENKAMGFGVETRVLSVQKMFSERISHTGTYRSYGTKCRYKGKNTCGKYLYFTWRVESPPYSKYGTGKTLG